MDNNQEQVVMRLIGLRPPQGVPIGLNADGLFHPEYFCQKCQISKEPVGPRLLRCTKCKMTHYCGRKCQKLDWFSHKTVCGVPFEDLEGDMSQVCAVYAM